MRHIRAAIVSCGVLCVLTGIVGQFSVRSAVAQLLTPHPVVCIPDCATILSTLEVHGTGEVIIAFQDGSDSYRYNTASSAIESLAYALRSQPYKSATLPAALLVIAPRSAFAVFSHVTAKGFS